MNDQNPSTPTIDDLVSKLSGTSQAPSSSQPYPPTPPVAPSATQTTTTATRVTPTPPRPVGVAPTMTAPMPPRPEIRPAPAPSSPEMQSSIRTMATDMGSIKQGQKPSGTDLIKPLSIPTPPVAPSATQTTTTTTTATRVTPTPPRPVGVAPTTTAPSQSFRIPTPQEPSQGSSRKIRPVFLVSALVILVVGVLVYWLLTRTSTPDDIIVQPTPTATPTPTPPPVAILADYFKTSTPVEFKISSTANELNAFLAFIKGTKVAPLSFTPILLNEYDANGLLSRSEVDILGPLATRWGLVMPEEVQKIIGSEQIILAYGQTESYNSKGVLEPTPTTTPSPRLVIVAEIVDSVVAKDVLTKAESTIIDSWSKLFSIKLPTKPVQFKDNIYRQNLIRFANFPYADNSLDYVIVNGENGKTYIVIAGSRESAFAAIDRIIAPPVK